MAELRDQEQYEHIALRREDDILEVRFHTDGGPLQWGLGPHAEFGRAFRAIAADRRNKVVILTGTGDVFCGPRAAASARHAMPARAWETVHADGIELIEGLLSIPALIVAAVNGPALRHAELALLSDIVLCSEQAEFQDSAHFPGDLTPGDGINMITPLLMGLNRSRYFHLTGQVIPAQQAYEWGLVNEVLSPELLQGRAWELARLLALRRHSVIRHTRLLHTHMLRKLLLDLVPYGLALEGLEVADNVDRP